MSSAERRAVAAAARIDLDIAGRRANDTAPTDPYVAGWLGQFHLQESIQRSQTGIVVDVVPGAQMYRVMAGHQSYIWCTIGSTDSSFTSSGVRPTDTIPLSSRIRFYRPEEAPHTGVIIGIDPYWSAHTGFMPADTIWPFVRTGMYADVAHLTPITISADNAQLGEIPLGGTEGADWSAGRPYDATAGGEWGRKTETGLGLFLDPWQIYLRVDETTGIFGFYADSMLRVAGHNFQEFTAQTEREELADEGEFAGWSRRTVYPWEAYGLWYYNQVTPGWELSSVNNNGLAAGQGLSLNDPAFVQSGSGYGFVEPESLGQISAPRIQSWGGYLGQGGHSTVSAPMQLAFSYPTISSDAQDAEVAAIGQTGAPAGRLEVNGITDPTTQPLAVPPNSYTAGVDQPCLHEDHVTLTGGRRIRFAHDFILAKRLSIPTPRPVTRQEDPAGDSPTSGYAPSGLSDGVQAHFVDGDPTPGSDPGRRMCQLPDAIAYMFNWENLHPFAYHTNDWSIAQEGATGADVVNQEAPYFSNLETEQYLAAPSPVYLDIDHRYGFTEYYETESVFAMLADGSIVIRDGCGGEIRMGGGNIEIRCPGDLRIHTGRRVIAWGGDDIVIRAHKSLDLTAANGDLRTKAEFNSHHLSGNSGCGGFLFESKAICPVNVYSATAVGEAVGSSGFTILCDDSQFVVSAVDIDIALSSSAPSDARITLDAGNNTVQFLGQFVTTYLNANGTALILFDGSDTAAVEINESYVLVGQNLLVGGGAVVSGCFSCAASIQCSGNLYPGQTVSTTGITNRINYLTSTYAVNWVDQVFRAPGSEAAEFTMRTADQYGSTDFVFWSSHWEAVARASAQTLNIWSEPVVQGSVSGVDTYPHPGEVWVESGSYAYQTYGLVNGPDGWIAIDRNVNRDAYEEPDTPAESTDSLYNRYPVIIPAPE